MFRILVVDDDVVDRLSVKRALTKAGTEFELAEANNCAEAIAIVQEFPFDCIFLDYCLPDGDGLSLIQQVRQLGISIPLIVLTGQGDEQIAVDLMKAGATDYLAKSRISPERLLQIVHSAVRVYQAEREVERTNQRLRETNELLLRKNQELEIQRQQIHLQNLKLLENSRLKSQFLATMSHELRTPLNVIIGFSQLLLRPTKGIVDPHQRDIIERILNNGKHLLTLLNEILDFSKLEAGGLEINPKNFHLEKIIKTTVAEVSPLADEKQLSLEIRYSLSNSEILNDPERLRQILTNLLSNAVKFTSQGKVWVDVTEATPNIIEIAVGDTGIGIALPDIDCIFEPFRQLDQTISRKHPGTGLGLAITKSLVQMMHGEITVESQLGQGSVFRVRFPRSIALQDLSETMSLYSP
ncbi:signal transduction histidine kinase [Leptolyngbyaceae cyanobacterium JSC-12]|nr:signal transduction histidine kinase [Leptolyngbyaceae cyanobacterium JSC-12]